MRRLLPVAAALKADKLIALDDARGLPDDDGELLTEMTPQELEHWLETAEDGSDAASERPGKRERCFGPCAPGTAVSRGKPL